MYTKTTFTPSLSALCNTRDIGNQITENGKRIKPGCLFRSGELYEATEDEINYLNSYYNIGTIIDLRTSSEKQSKPDPLVKNTKYIFLPLLSEDKVGITTKSTTENSTENYLDYVNLVKGLKIPVQEYMANLYNNLVTDSYAIQQYNKFFHILLSSDESESILWHCSIGKDRAGIISALVLSALGVNRENILIDYMKTNQNIKSRITYILQKAVKINSDPVFSDSLYNLLAACEVYLVSALDTIEQKYNTIKDYIIDCIGVDEYELNLLQQKYLI